MLHLFGIIISTSSLIEMLSLLRDSHYHLILMFSLFIFPQTHLMFIKLEQKYWLLPE